MIIHGSHRFFGLSGFLSLLFAVVLLFVFSSCAKSRGGEELQGGRMEYASFLQIKNLGDGVSLCRILNPWRNGDEVLAQYLLVPRSAGDFDKEKELRLRESFGDFTVVSTPLRRLMLANSCHGYLFHELGAPGNIAVMCEAEYVSYQPVKELIEAGKILNGGNGMAPNIEVILAAGCDAILVSPFESQLSSVTNLPASIPTVFCADYMETSPLGRAEWMKFYGLLVGEEQTADSLFAAVVSGYHDNVGAVEQAKKTLLAETPYQGTWFVPGGQSTMAVLYRDAGYDYPWAEDSHSGSLALSSEEVLSRAQNADVWLMKYYADHDYSLAEFVAQDSYFQQFEAARKGEVYGCNTRNTDYYDVMPFRPDLLIKELRHLGSGYFKRLE